LKGYLADRKITAEERTKVDLLIKELLDDKKELAQIGLWDDRRVVKQRDEIAGLLNITAVTLINSLAGKMNPLGFIMEGEFSINSSITWLEFGLKTVKNNGIREKLAENLKATKSIQKQIIQQEQRLELFTATGDWGRSLESYNSRIESQRKAQNRTVLFQIFARIFGPIIFILIMFLIYSCSN
jgi:hypothetical protein